jgi:hypothetical protein
MKPKLRTLHPLAIVQGVMVKRAEDIDELGMA